MGGKMLIFLGLIASAIYAYWCINTKKDTLYAELNHAEEQTLATPVEAESTQEALTPIKVVQALKPTSFAYVLGEKDKIAGFFSQKDKDSEVMEKINTLCPEDTCIKEIKFFDDVKTFDSAHEALALIAYAKKENIKDFALYLDKESVKVEGTLASEEQKSTIQPYLDAFEKKGYTLNSLLKTDNLEPILKEEILKEEFSTEAAKEELVTPEHLSVEDAAKEINKILSSNTITFEYRSSEISQESKKILDDVIDILLGLDNTTIQVAGYTDSKGDAIYNKVLSQKRADSVASYLVKSGVRSKLIKSVGYGEENPISDPADIANRRVEIHLKEGE